MIKLLTVIGARPQIIKAAAISRAIRTKYFDTIREVIVHTGQHYDANMSAIFFEEMSIPQPHYNLNVGSCSHGKQTGQMIAGIEDILISEQPDFLVVYGDTNSTLAAAIAASKLNIPVAHIEAGLRSFNKSMPEEVNRILCDHVSTLLFTPTHKGFDNLISEGFGRKMMILGNDTLPSADHPRVYLCGDVMYDNSLHFTDIAKEKSTVLERLQIKEDEYILATIHRNNNTDDPERLSAIFEALDTISEENSVKVVLPLHPRTEKLLCQSLTPALFEKIRSNKNFIITEPASFLDMIELERKCALIATDSGGVQKESYFFCKPCIILRPETEWVELIEHGTAIIADANKDRIVQAYRKLSDIRDFQFPPIYGDGKAAEFICEKILETLICKQKQAEHSET